MIGVDLDGTLINSLNYHLKSFIETSKKLNINLSKDQIRIIKESIGLPATHILKIVGIKQVKKFAVERRKTFLNKFMERIKPLPYSSLFLKEFEKELILISASSKDFVNHIVRKFGWEKYFYLIITSNTFKKHLNKIDVLKELFKRFNLDKSSFIYVGDSIYDALACKRAKIKFVAVTTGFHKKEDFELLSVKFICKNLKEAIRVIKEIS